MTQNPRNGNHLTHIRDHLVRLMSMLETAHPDPAAIPPGTADALSLGRSLLLQVSVAERTLGGDPASAAALAHVDERYRASLERLEDLREEIEHLPHPKRPDTSEHPSSSGSTIGDAVRDGFLNMG